VRCTCMLSGRSWLLAAQKHVDYHFFPQFMGNDTILKREHWCEI